MVKHCPFDCVNKAVDNSCVYNSCIYEDKKEDVVHSVSFSVPNMCIGYDPLNEYILCQNNNYEFTTGNKYDLDMKKYDIIFFHSKEEAQRECDKANEYMRSTYFHPVKIKINIEEVDNNED